MISTTVPQVWRRFFCRVERLYRRQYMLRADSSGAGRFAGAKRDLAEPIDGGRAVYASGYGGKVARSG